MSETKKNMKYKYVSRETWKRVCYNRKAIGKEYK